MEKLGSYRTGGIHAECREDRDNYKRQRDRLCKKQTKLLNLLYDLLEASEAFIDLDSGEVGNPDLDNLSDAVSNARAFLEEEGGRE